MITLAFIQNLGPTEIGVIAVVVIFLFGAKALPKFAKGLGESVREFRQVGKELTNNFDKEAEKTNGKDNT